MAGPGTAKQDVVMQAKYYFSKHLVDLRVSSLLSLSFTFLKRCTTQAVLWLTEN